MVIFIILSNMNTTNASMNEHVCFCVEIK